MFELMTQPMPALIGAQEGVLIVIALVLLFGGSKIPELLKGLGSGIKEFKKASRDEKPEDDARDEA
jgi:sec-independent protein translocase protein TatA